MPYTMEDFRRENKEYVLQQLTPEEKLQGLTAEERLIGLSAEELLKRVPPEEIEAYLRRLREQGEDGEGH